MDSDSARLVRRGYGRVGARLYYHGPLKACVRTPESHAFESTKRCAAVALSNLHYRLEGLRQALASLQRRRESKSSVRRTLNLGPVVRSSRARLDSDKMYFRLAVHAPTCCTA